MEESYEEHVETVSMACRDDELSRELEGLAMLPLRKVVAAGMHDTDPADGGKDDVLSDDGNGNDSRRNGVDGGDESHASRTGREAEPFEPKKCSLCNMTLGRQMHVCTACRFAVCWTCRNRRRKVWSSCMHRSVEQHV